MKQYNPNKIGGEFEIDPAILEGFPEFLPDPENFLYSSGRSGLTAILNMIATKGPSIIHIPFYICPSVVKTCESSGFEIQFYELDSHFRFIPDYLDSVKQGDALLIVNYFGFIDDNPLIDEIRKIRPDIVIISDHVQSIWTCAESEADFSFTSYRKHFATPDGAKVFQKRSPLPVMNDVTENRFYWPKFIAAILKQIQIKDEVFLYFFEKGEEILDHSSNISRASLLGHYLTGVTNFETIRNARMNNYKSAYELGWKYGLEFVFPYDENVVPLCVPVLVERRDSIRTKLIRENIFLPVHWPIESYNKKSALSVKMAEKELSLVIDQRYTHKDIELQIKKIIT
jgi:hypothetical protein